MEKVFILVSCDIGAEHDLAAQLIIVDGIRNATVTYGEYDIVVEVESENADTLNTLITEKIRKIEKIRSTITLNVTH